MAEITLRDIDNRDDTGKPYEITTAVESVIGYLDGPLRRDLSEPAIGGPDIDEAIGHVRAGRLDEANALLNHMNVWLYPFDPANNEGDNND